MYYRQFNGLDDVNEVQRTQFLERSSQLWQNSRTAGIDRFESGGYFMANLKGEFTQPADVKSDIKQISFVSKANQMFGSAGPQSAYSQTAVAMDKSKKTAPQPIQEPGLPKWSTKSPKALAIEAPRRTKKEAELESAVKILQAKLEYTERKITESENNKELLKSRLDTLISQLTKAGFDPNLKVARPAKQLSRQAPLHPPKTEEVRVKAIQPSEPPVKASLAPFGTSRPAKVSDESWEKLLSLANEYEQRLNIIKSLEEQEKYVKQQLTAPRNPLSDETERQHSTVSDRR